jgi:N6-adenosine-specific RNA methylase IME4
VEIPSVTDMARTPCKRFHPIANVLPLIDGAEFDRLVADIAEQGLLNPITLYQGQVLDGRNRECACHAAGVEARYVEFDGKDPAAFVLSQNLARRHLGPSERAMVAARLATLKDGQRQVGKFAYVRESPEAQADFLAAVANGRTFQSWQNNHGRKKRAAELAATTKAMPVGEARWPVILADPPWDFEVYAPDKQMSHPAPPMSLDEIKALPVAKLTFKDCVLDAWGFEYQSGLVWDKENPGMGYWIRGRHEFLLLSTKGKPPLPATENVPVSVICERRREHSRKPEASYALIERMFPDLPKLELFARQARPGWDAWGNETDKFTDDKRTSLR